MTHNDVSIELKPAQTRLYALRRVVASRVVFRASISCPTRPSLRSGGNEIDRIALVLNGGTVV